MLKPEILRIGTPEIVIVVVTIAVMLFLFFVIKGILLFVKNVRSTNNTPKQQ